VRQDGVDQISAWMMMAPTTSDTPNSTIPTPARRCARDRSPGRWSLPAPADAPLGPLSLDYPSTLPSRPVPLRPRARPRPLLE
jgi:hypothetical protein